MKTTAVLLTSLALLQAASASATVLFADSFDRADSRNTSESLAGITDNTGSALAPGAVYLHPWLDPNNQAPAYGVEDGAAANGGGGRILANRLQLAVGPGTSNALVNHNFINPEITAAGGMTVALDVTGFAQGARQYGGGFAIGMSLAEAMSAQDAFNTTDPSMTGAFAGDPFGVINSPVSGNVVSDFWVGLRGNNSIAWGGSSGNVLGVGGLAGKTGGISVNFFFGDFNAGTDVSYEVYLDSALQGSGTFKWSGTNENFIGIDTRDSSGVSVDGFSITTIPESSVALLGLAGMAGMLRRRR